MDQALKQRLVGATVLIVLGVILLPMLLSGQPEFQNETARIEVPEKPPELSIETRRFPVGGRDPVQPPQVDERPIAEPEPQEMAEEAAVAADEPRRARRSRRPPLRPRSPLPIQNPKWKPSLSRAATWSRWPVSAIPAMPITWPHS